MPMDQSSPPVAEPTTSPAPPSSQVAAPILEIKNLHTSFYLEKGTVRAVNGVNLSLGRREWLRQKRHRSIDHASGQMAAGQDR